MRLTALPRTSARRIMAALAASAVLMLSGSLLASAAQPAGSAERSPVIVVFRDDVADAAGLTRQLGRAFGFSPRYTYQHAIKGFAATIPGSAASAIARNPNVAWVEADGVVQLDGDQAGPPSWGLDRIDQRTLPLSDSYHYDATGAGVTAYIIDTGIRISHVDFGGRATYGYDAVDGSLPADDCHGHGTHVAGTVGGTNLGVAKGVSLVAVRVLDCRGSGSWSGVIAGIDWVTANHTGSAPAVANMSLGGGASSSVDAAVQRSIADGVSYAIAAGNGNRGGVAQDACGSSPARVPEAMTIGATTSTDVKASWSNYGPCVDWFAPGVGITSAWATSDTATYTISGTSMATPHTAGVAALYLQQHPSDTPQQVRDALFTATTKGVVTSSGTANNHLLYSLFGGSGGGGGGGTGSNVAPTADFTWSCTYLDCTFTDASTDGDGTVVAWAWDFGDGTSSVQDPQHAFAAAGTYTVRLTVTDDDLATGSTQKSVTVTAAPVPGSFDLAASGRKVRGWQFVDLSWSGSSATSFDVWRDGSKIATVSGTSTIDELGVKGGGSVYVYKVCQAGSTTTCSNEVTVVF
jgi:PKD repeat protein